MADVSAGTAIRVSLALIVFVSIAIQGIVSPVFEGSERFDDRPVAGNDTQLTTGVGRFVDRVPGVRATLGDAVELTGAPDSEVQLETDLELDNQWSVCTYAQADAAVVTENESRALVGMNDVVVSYNGSDGVWRTWFFNTSNRESYSANVSAPAPTEPTLVCGWHNGTHLRTTRNTTLGAAVATTGDGAAVDPPAANWHGRVEETRVFGRALDDNERAGYLNVSTVGVPGPPPPLVRITYDVRQRPQSSVGAYFTEGDAQLSNVTFVDGHQGPALDRGSDYRVSGSRISVPDGSVLDGDGDVLYVHYWVRIAHGELITLGVALFAIGIIMNRIIGLLAEL